MYFLSKSLANILCHILDYQTINDFTDANLLKQKQEYIQIITTVMCIQFKNTLKVIYIFFFLFSLFLIQQHLTTKSMCIFVCFIDELDRTRHVETKSQSEEIQGSNTDHCYAISKSEASRGIKQ